MSEMAGVEASRDVLAELDSINSFLTKLVGTESKPGHDSNRQRLAAEFASFKGLAQNIVELAAEAAAGVTYKQRLEKTMGTSLTDAQVAHLVPGIDDNAYRTAQEQIADLQRQLAEAKGGNA